MSAKKQLHAVIKSSDYVGNIHIPVTLVRPCVSYSLYNAGTNEVSITVRGKVLPIPANCRSGLVSYEKDPFTSLTIDTELGHNFILEIYRD